MHFVVDVFALRVEALQDLCQHVDRLLAAQTRALGLELLQQVFGGHRFTDQVAADCLLRQLHVTVGREQKHLSCFYHTWHWFSVIRICSLQTHVCAAV